MSKDPYESVPNYLKPLVTEELSKLTAWAKSLTDNQLMEVLNEMRNRGWAVAAYTADDAYELFEIVNPPENSDWFDSDAIEETMCEAGRRQILDQLTEVCAFDDEDDQ